MAVVLGAVNAAEPLALRHIFDALAGGRGARPFVHGLLALIALGLLREVFAGLSNWLTWRARIGTQFGLTKQTRGLFPMAA